MGRRSDTRGTDSTTTIIQETDGLVNWWCCGFGCFVNRIYDNVVLLLLLLLAVQSVHSAEGGVTKLTLHWMAGRLLCKLLCLWFAYKFKSLQSPIYGLRIHVLSCSLSI